MGILLVSFSYQSLITFLYNMQRVLKNPISIFSALYIINQLIVLPLRDLALSITLSVICFKDRVNIEVLQE
jgi:hypothetical protein